MDYTILALESSINDMKLIREHVQHIMKEESEFILSCLEAGMIVMEADTTNKPSVIDRMVGSMKAFFEKIKGLFRAKAVDQAKKHTDWIKSNRDAILKSAGKLTIEVLPYWSGDYTDHMRIIKSVVDGAVRNLEAKKYTHDYATKIISPKFVGDKNVIEYLKNFYRIGERDQLKIEQVKITGKELSSKVEAMLKYSIDYVGVAVPAVNQTSDHIVKAMDKMGVKLKTSTKSTDTKFKVTKESYMFVEDCIVRESDLVSCMNYTSVIEAEEAKAKPTEAEKEKTEVTNAEGEEKTATSVSVTSQEDETTDTEKEEKKEQSQEEINFINEVSSFIKLVFSAFTTVMEERYITYVNILRSIGTTKTIESEEDNTTEETPNTEEPTTKTTGSTDDGSNEEAEPKKKTSKQIRAELKAAKQEEAREKKLKRAQTKVDKLKKK